HWRQFVRCWRARSGVVGRLVQHDLSDAWHPDFFIRIADFGDRAQPEDSRREPVSRDLLPAGHFADCRYRTDLAVDFQPGFRTTELCLGSTWTPRRHQLAARSVDREAGADHYGRV